MLAIVENHWQDAHFDAFQEGLLSFTAALTFLMNPSIISYAMLNL